MNSFRRKLRVSVHRGIVDKNVPENRLFAEGWENVELTPEELVESIKNGHPYCAQISGYRNSKHFKASDIISLDIEHSLSIEEALENPIVRAHATILYTTVRHQPDAHRFRIIFVLPQTITDAREMSALVKALRLRVAGCAFRRSRPLIPTDRDQLFRSIATNAARVLRAPLDDGGDVSLLWVGQARREAVPVVNRTVLRVPRSAHTADAAARAGGPC